MTDKLQCPKCKNEDLETIHHIEWVPAQRSIIEIKDGRLLADSESEVFWEGAERESLECDSCGSTFDVPRDLVLSYS